MKKVGFILLGIGCGMLLYYLISVFFAPRTIQSPVEEPVVNTTIKEGQTLQK